jgi:hypothetical protein
MASENSAAGMMMLAKPRLPRPRFAMDRRSSQPTANKRAAIVPAMNREGDQALPAERRLRVEREDRSGGEEKVRDHVSQPRDQTDFVRVRDRQRDGTEREEGHGDREERAGQSVDGRGLHASHVQERAGERHARTGGSSVRQDGRPSLH